MAEAERAILETERTQTPADREFSMFSNKARTFLELAENVLDARIAAATASCLRREGNRAKRGTHKHWRLHWGPQIGRLIAEDSGRLGIV
jgi:hypothetical protein